MLLEAFLAQIRLLGICMLEGQILIAYLKIHPVTSFPFF
jgi:hypothetical protein